MRPLQLEIMHGRSTTRQMGWLIGRIGLGVSVSKIWRRGSQTKRVGGVGGIEGEIDLFGYVEDGSDSTFDKAFPVAGIVF